MEFPENKKAKTDHEVMDLIKDRWSPRSFSAKPISDSDLASILEAARWAASAYNEQPWVYIVAKKENKDQFEKILSCLVEFNQGWAKNAQVVMLGFARKNFVRGEKYNPTHAHDLGLASSQMLLEAMNRNIFTHQMSGILPEKIRDIYNVPTEYEPITALAFGYMGDLSDLSDDLKEGEMADRNRKPLAEFVFERNWGESASFSK